MEQESLDTNTTIFFLQYRLPKIGLLMFYLLLRPLPLSPFPVSKCKMFANDQQGHGYCNANMRCVILQLKETHRHTLPSRRKL